MYDLIIIGGAGFWGLLYWNVLVLAHNQIFRRMPRAMVRRAEWLDAVGT